ncbi:unnamed protein product [Acanthoscelides obtectus]|uniref:Uncharacterized protein n=1 Tax=Acanthoscelides obtectus TaxID=200917 RepID=A0A9P0PR42_ACAOB|nr:unnamed protein product [Acanthoscelides obtectus]CAK1632198.1 hypothetical protein AOBTE_LOCUS7402 [Acanthoscelides obtectus]
MQQQQQELLKHHIKNIQVIKQQIHQYEDTKHALEKLQRLSIHDDDDDYEAKWRQNVFHNCARFQRRPKMSHLSLEKFECNGESTSVGARWERWKRALFIYLEAANIDRDIKKRTSLLHFGGLDLQEVFYNIPGANVEPAEGVDVFETAISKLDAYFAPRQSKVFERHTFRPLKQEPEKF